MITSPFFKVFGACGRYDHCGIPRTRGSSHVARYTGYFLVQMLQVLGANCQPRYERSSRYVFWSASVLRVERVLMGCCMEEGFELLQNRPIAASYLVSICHITIPSRNAISVVSDALKRQEVSLPSVCDSGPRLNSVLQRCVLDTHVGGDRFVLMMVAIGGRERDVLKSHRPFGAHCSSRQNGRTFRQAAHLLSGSCSLLRIYTHHVNHTRSQRKYDLSPTATPPCKCDPVALSPTSHSALTFAP